ncbi:diguanylate cyclase [Winslowiella toletana]|uniref:diguanylate cyclase n=1 Tax=Winslowiella toletana TaxID=92490 RepID=UPI0028BE05EF|nr:diguanylate cyclase [Winslowiella toletana]WNN42868.1 diguanylate cyclase [Winslowiella toletana]
MDFSRESIHRHLQRAIQQKHQGVVLLLDRQQNVLASSDSPPAIEGHALSTSEKQQLKNALQQGVRGELRFGTRYLTWDKLRGFDGVIVNIQTLAEGLKGDQGRIVLVLILMWLLFSLILLGSYYAIIRLISKMMRLQNKLEWRANYDGLTRLYNRAAFFDLSERCAAQCQRSHRPLSLIQLDIDFFKSVNDNYGHQAGDSALSHVAGIITQSLRRMDIAGRVGGEEFCLLLPETQLEEAVAVAERIRHQLAQKELMISIDQTVILTASFGVASSEEQGDYQTDSLQSLADSRLYQAKQSGRNRVCWQS